MGVNIGLIGLLFISLFCVSSVLIYRVFAPKALIQSRVSQLSVPTVERVGDMRGNAASRSKHTSQRWYIRLESTLKRAEIHLTAREFLLRWVGVTGCAGLLCGVITNIFVALLIVIGAFLGTRFYLNARMQRRLRRLDESLPDMVTLVCNSLRAGHSFVQALQVVCLDMRGPIQEEFQRINAEMQVGVGLEEALQRANERIGSEDFDIITTAITIQRQVGGNLAEVLERIAETIRERVRMKREVKALTAQGRMSALIFMFLPIGVGGILFVMNPPYFGAMFQSPIGIGMLVAAAMGQAIGFLFIRRIINVEM